MESYLYQYLLDNIYDILYMDYISPDFLSISYPTSGYVGYDERASGLFLPGGSYCTLIGMICARYHKFPASKRAGLNFPIQVHV